MSRILKFLLAGRYGPLARMWTAFTLISAAIRLARRLTRNTEETVYRHAMKPDERLEISNLRPAKKDRVPRRRSRPGK
ncbi:MAG: hypothetical protein ACT4OS_08240 [Acidimicrobiales bacterium]